MNLVRLFYTYVNILAILIMSGFGILAIAEIIIEHDIFTTVTYPWIWGTYSPYAYQVLVFVSAYFIGYRKFRWLSPFMFMFVWAFNDLYYNVYFDFYHIVPLVTGHLPQQIPDGPWVYLMKMSVEAIIMGVGAAFLRLKFNMSLKLIPYISLGIMVGNDIYEAIIGFPILYLQNSVINQFQAFISIVALLIFLYYTVISRATPEADML